MKCAAVICECNPFHQGHAYLFERIRALLGEDTLILAVMSGNTTQRGEFAIYEKHCRAERTVECGGDLVVELPFPYSCSTAERFASAAVSIVCGLGCADYLCFGSENGDGAALEAIASNLIQDGFEADIKAEIDRKKGICEPFSYAKLRSECYYKRYSKKLPDTPNDILAIEYLIALRRIGDGRVKPLAVKRGEGYPPASRIRDEIRANNPCAPDVSSIANLTPAILSFFRLCDPKSLENIADVPPGLAAKMIKEAGNSVNIDDFIGNLPTKYMTEARIRRAVLYSLCGVASEDIRRMPAYTVLLAANARGKALLSSIRRTASLPVITRHREIINEGIPAQRQWELCERSDALFALTFPEPKKSSFSIAGSPVFL